MCSLPGPGIPEVLAEGLMESYRQLLAVYTGSTQERLQQAWLQKQPEFKRRLQVIRELSQ